MTKIKSKEKIPLEQKEIDKKLIFILDEAIPTEQAERKKYIGDIAFFYSTIFKKKLQHFRGLQLEELAQLGRTELGNNIIRSNINCFNLISDWMEKMTNEHLGDLESIRESFTENEDFIKNIKEKYD